MEHQCTVSLNLLKQRRLSGIVFLSSPSAIWDWHRWIGSGTGFGEQDLRLWDRFALRA